MDWGATAGFVGMAGAVALAVGYFLTLIKKGKNQGTLDVLNIANAQLDLMKETLTQNAIEKATILAQLTACQTSLAVSAREVGYLKGLIVQNGHGPLGDKIDTLLQALKLLPDTFPPPPPLVNL